MEKIPQKSYNSAKTGLYSNRMPWEIIVLKLSPNMRFKFNPQYF